MVTLPQPVLQYQPWPLFNSSSPARMIFLSSKFNLFMPLLRIIYGFPLLQDEVRITQCDKCQCYKTLPFPGLVSFHTLQACPTIDPFSNIVSFQNPVLWYILSPLAQIHLTLTGRTQVNTICPPRLISGKTAMNFPSSMKCPLCPATLPVLHSIQSTPCPVLGFVALLPVFTTLTFLTSTRIAAVPRPWQVFNKYLLTRCVLWLLDGMNTSAIMEVWSAYCRGKYSGSEVRACWWPALTLPTLWAQFGQLMFLKLGLLISKR